MEMDLKNLIDKIKQDGVKEADAQAKKIIAEATEKAKAIIKDADNKKAESIKEAGLRAKDFQAQAEKALKQSARDVLLTLRGRVTEFFERVVKQKTSEALKIEVLQEIIISAVNNFRKDTDLDIEVLVSKKDREKLEKTLFNSLSKEAKDHLTLSESKGIEAGFRIGENGKGSYFDFTDDAISEAFTRYLNPKLVEMLDIGLGLDKENDK